MIHSATKKKLLSELEKGGNVYFACLKAGINRATYYRWWQENEEFRKKAKQAVRHGRENICDIARHALMINVKEKKMEAIKYALGHLDPLFKNKQSSNVVILHKKDIPSPENQPRTIEDLIAESRKDNHEEGLELYKQFTNFGGVIPPKPDGTKIDIDELPLFRPYIENWQKSQRNKEEQERIKNISITPDLTNIADSKSEMDIPSVGLQENQKPLDT